MYIRDIWHKVCNKGGSCPRVCGSWQIAPSRTLMAEPPGCP